MTMKFFLNKITCGKFFNDEQVKLISKANEQVHKDLDIFMLINKLKEIEKIKSLFLSKNQETLFNFFPKPVISIKDSLQNFSRAELTEKVKSMKKNDSSF